MADELSEYAVTQPDGSKITMLLDKADAERYGAVKVKAEAPAKNKQRTPSNKTK